MTAETIEPPPREILVPTLAIIVFAVDKTMRIQPSYHLRPHLISEIGFVEEEGAIIPDICCVSVGDCDHVVHWL